jgi:hypothetical protein
MKNSSQWLEQLFTRQGQTLELNILHSTKKEFKDFSSFTVTSTYPKIPELMSPAGNPIAIMFSVIYVISKSKPPS